MKTEQALSPIQEVRPIATKPNMKEPETQLNIWIPKSLMKSLKRFSIEKEKTIKDSVIEAISKHVKEKN